MPHVGSGTRDSIHQPAPRQLAKRAADGNSRRSELLYQRRFAGELLPIPVLAREDVSRQALEDLLIFRDVRLGGKAAPAHELILQL